jgi:hypothetical protein
MNRYATYAGFLPLAGAPLLSAFVTLWWPWLLVTGHTQIPFMSDTNAAYGVFCFSPKTGAFDVFQITGEFPHARYVSFMVYGGSRSQPFAALADYAIKPDPGSVNPFLPQEDRTAPNRSYTIYAIREGSGIDPSAYDNVLMIPKSETFINLMMRVYRPDDGLDVLGGVPLPTVAVGRASGAVAPPWYGLASDIGALFKMFLGVHYQEAQSYARLHDDNTIHFYRLSREGGLPNVDIPYLDTALGGTESGSNATLAVLKFRAPTFENTDGGGGTLDGHKNVRYYSFCTSDVATGFNSQCISDSDLKVDEDGTVTLVVYPPVLEDRVKRSGLNRLIRGYSETTSLTYRQLLPAADFAGAASNVPRLPLPLSPDINLDDYKASVFIGDYSPTGTYYTGGEFEAWLHSRTSGRKPR